MCDVEVAWCLNDGGAVAITFAFARLAAIAAATLLFLTFGVAGAFAFDGSGHAFSSCFLAVESNVLIIRAALSSHVPLNTQ